MLLVESIEVGEAERFRSRENRVIQSEVAISGDKQCGDGCRCAICHAQAVNVGITSRGREG